MAHALSANMRQIMAQSAKIFQEEIFGSKSELRGIIF